MRIAFFGTGEIGLPTLHWLLESGHEICAVITQPDKPVGRRHLPTPPQVKLVAQARGIPVLQPEKIRQADDLEILLADVFVVVAYGQILPARILKMPRLACINLHASLLPKYRGASPIQAAILHGDTTTAMTVMHMDVGLDTGDAILSEDVAILPDETGGSLHDKLAAAGPIALGRALLLLENGDAPRFPQNPALATHTRKLSREDGRIDWQESALEIERKIRAYHPWPGTSSLLGGEMVKIFPPTCIVQGDEISQRPGTILGLSGDCLMVACGSGRVGIGGWQIEGRKKSGAPDFLRGRPGLIGQILHEN